MDILYEMNEESYVDGNPDVRICKYSLVHVLGSTIVY